MAHSTTPKIDVVAGHLLYLSVVIWTISSSSEFFEGVSRVVSEDSLFTLNRLPADCSVTHILCGKVFSGFGKNFYPYMGILPLTKGSSI